MASHHELKLHMPKYSESSSQKRVTNFDSSASEEVSEMKSWREVTLELFIQKEKLPMVKIIRYMISRIEHQIFLCWNTIIKFNKLLKF